MPTQFSLNFGARVVAVLIPAVRVVGQQMVEQVALQP
jgi:hypothetical protein